MPSPEVTTEYAERRERLQERLKEFRLGGFVVSALPNVRYLSGFTGSNGLLFITRGRALLFTDPRYATQAPQETDCEVKIAKGPLTLELRRSITRLKVRVAGFEENRISFDEYKSLKNASEGIRLKPVRQAVEALRMIKSNREIETITNSVELNSNALEEALKHFRPLMTEVELAAEIDYRMRRLGADGTAFDTIVASGERTALPHARPTADRVKPNQLLLIDVGANVAGYASDMTRTYAVGKLDAKTRQMHRAVLESQLAAIDAVKPGVSCAQVDRAARKVLRGYGLEKLFVHSTGHGLGIEIHEFPRVGRKERTKLEVGMTITVEPGVYQEGLGGVRIEDTVVVTTRGCDVLAPTSKELVVL